MRFKYNHGGETYEFAVAETKLTSPTGVVRHNNANNYVPLVNPADKNASHLRVRRNGIIRAPIRYFGEPIDMLNGRTIADVQQIFQSGLGKYYFKAGDYFDITFPTEIILDAGGSIPANSTWRAVCLGIDHNAEIEGYNRGHFFIGYDTNNVKIAFYGKRMNPTDTNAGGWAGCEMRTFLNTTFYNALPADLKAVIAPCTKYTDNVGGITNLPEAVTATSDNIWLLSAYEANPPDVYVNPAELQFIQRYDYQKNGNTSIFVQSNKYSARAGFWYRSCRINNETNFFMTKNNVNSWKANTRQASNIYCFLPCFTIA